jgi:hypothetical protein
MRSLQIMNTPPSFSEDWPKSDIGHDLDESVASDFVGKVILLGVTYENSLGEVTGQQQWSGTIKTYSNTLGIQIDLDDSDEFCAIPPMAEAISKAPEGEYRLRSTGKVIVNPAYLATWICKKPEEKANHAVEPTR